MSSCEDLFVAITCIYFARISVKIFQTVFKEMKSKTPKIEITVYQSRQMFISPISLHRMQPKKFWRIRNPAPSSVFIQRPLLKLDEKKRKEEKIIWLKFFVPSIQWKKNQTRHFVNITYALVNSGRKKKCPKTLSPKTKPKIPVKITPHLFLFIQKRKSIVPITLFFSRKKNWRKP